MPTPSLFRVDPHSAHITFPLFPFFSLPPRPPASPSVLLSLPTPISRVEILPLIAHCTRLRGLTDVLSHLQVELPPACLSGVVVFRFLEPASVLFYLRCVILHSTWVSCGVRAPTRPVLPWRVPFVLSIFLSFINAFCSPLFPSLFVHLQLVSTSSFFVLENIWHLYDLKLARLPVSKYRSPFMFVFALCVTSYVSLSPSSILPTSSTLRLSLGSYQDEFYMSGHSLLPIPPRHFPFALRGIHLSLT